MSVYLPKVCFTDVSDPKAVLFKSVREPIALLFKSERDPIALLFRLVRLSMPKLSVVRPSVVEVSLSALEDSLSMLAVALEVMLSIELVKLELILSNVGKSGYAPSPTFLPKAT